MNPTAMTLLLTSGFGLFVISSLRRWRLLFLGATRRPAPLADWRMRWSRVIRDGLLQSRLRQYRGPGWAHTFVFMGFMVLLARTLMLWGRGFDPQFELWALGPAPIANCPLGEFYGIAKDFSVALVLLSVSYFFLQRLFWKPARLRLSAEGLLILALIAALMVSDEVYDGASLLLATFSDRTCEHSRAAECSDLSTIAAGVGWHMRHVRWRFAPDPLGSLVALGLRDFSPTALVRLATVGFWSHSVLVLVFLNWLPYSKHFHVLTALPNLLLASTRPAGKLDPIAESAEALLQRADQLQSSEPAGIAPVGISRIEDLTWKDRLDLYSCTECGRCTDNCPAFRTGKPLSPMQLTLDLRSELLSARDRLTPSRNRANPADRGSEANSVDAVLIPRVINPETIWSCTTCRACEERCPVGISYVDKIVGLRRDLVLMRGEVPAQLQKTFEGMERNGNPWNLARQQRTDWCKALDVPRLSAVSGTDVLYWAGCAASYDDRAQRVAKALVSLMRLAGVDFAILGEEETCTGDAARRAGNEYLFLQLATRNVDTLNRYYRERQFKRIVTACPHCLTTLKNEYPDFGGVWPIFNHSEFLLDLVRRGALRPQLALNESITFHDPCTLARYANDVVSTRQLLRNLPGISAREAEHNSQFTLCCGAGGARMWIDEGGGSRMNDARSRELLATGANQVVTACPFCATMLSDGLSGEPRSMEVLDIAELLAKACQGQASGISPFA